MTQDQIVEYKAWMKKVAPELVMPNWKALVSVTDECVKRDGVLCLTFLPQGMLIESLQFHIWLSRLTGKTIRQLDNAGVGAILSWEGIEWN